MKTIVDLKYKKPLVGKYNKCVSRCLECDHDFLNNPKYGTLFDHIIGFNESHIGLVAMWECPVCFKKWFYHGQEHYDYFLNAIKGGTQKFFKNKVNNNLLTLVKCENGPINIPIIFNNHLDMLDYIKNTNMDV